MSPKEVISWDLFEKETLQLVDHLKESGPWKGVVGIARGGLVPTAIIANAMGIRNVKSVAAVSYDDDNKKGAVELLGSVNKVYDGDGWLFVDDLVDTGQTAQLIKKRYPKSKIAVVYAKPKGTPYADFIVRKVEQNCWLEFPWE